jgi:hypothetical protein
LIPEAERKLGVGATEDGGEVVFECLNLPFGRIAPMNVGRYQLKVDVFLSNGSF